MTDFIKTPRQAQRVGPCIKVLGGKTIDLIDEAKRRYLQVMYIITMIVLLYAEG